MSGPQCQDRNVRTADGMQLLAQDGRQVERLARRRCKVRRDERPISAVHAAPQALIVQHQHMTRMARAVDTTIFVKNGPSLAGLGHEGQGFSSMTIATPTGHGIVGPIAYTRQRRCVLVDYLRIV